MDKKSLEFIKSICASEYLSQDVKVERTYAVLMYMLNVSKTLISAEEAERIMDCIKSGEPLDF